jgi:hypothetical protein
VRRGRVVGLVFFLAGASIIFPFIAAVTCFSITSPFAESLYDSIATDAMEILSQIKLFCLKKRLAINEK